MGSIFQVATKPIGRSARFRSERDMEIFLYEHPGFLAEHLSIEEAEGEVARIWRQVQLPQGYEHGGGGRTDLVFLLRDASTLKLYVAELKNGWVGPGEVEQLTQYLANWSHDENSAVTETIAQWITGHTDLDAELARSIAARPQGVLIAPAFLPEGIEALVEWAKAHREAPVQALKLHRFRAAGGTGHLVFVDDVYVVPPSGPRVIRWRDLHDRFPTLVSTDTVFVLECGGRAFEAYPVLDEGRGKNFRLAEHHVAEALELTEVAVARTGQKYWEATKIGQVAEQLEHGESVPMSNLTLYLQRAFSDRKEPDWQTPAGQWVRKDDPERRTIQQLDALLR